MTELIELTIAQARDLLRSRKISAAELAEAHIAAVDVANIEPMTSVTPMAMKKRPDIVTDGEMAKQILRNAPETQDGFFLVPKVVE